MSTYSPRLLQSLHAAQIEANHDLHQRVPIVEGLAMLRDDDELLQHLYSLLYVLCEHYFRCYPIAHLNLN